MPLFLFLVSLLPFVRHPIWSRDVNQISVVKYVGLACFLYAVIHVASRRRLPAYLSTPQARLFLVFLGAVCLSYATSPGTFTLEVNPFISYASFAVMFIITLSVVDSVRRLRWVLLTTVGSLGFGSLYVLREWQKYRHYGFLRAPAWDFGDSNGFAVSVLISLPLGCCLLLERRPLWERLFCFLSLVVMVVALLLGASRGGFLGLVAACLVLIWRSRRRGRYAAVTIVLAGAIGLAPISPLQRLLHPRQGDTQAVENRENAWRAGFRMVEAHPLTGIGLGAFKAMMLAYADTEARRAFVAHNTYLEVAAEMGLPSLLVFLALLFFSYRSLRRTWEYASRHGPPLVRHAALGLEAGLAGSCVAVFFISGESVKLFWFAIFLSMCLPTLVNVRRPQERPAVVHPNEPVLSAEQPIGGR